jgi:hypothetical protein
VPSSAPPPLESLQKAKDAILRLGSVNGAAKEIGVHRATLQGWVERAPVWYPGFSMKGDAPAIALPTFPDQDIPAEQILDQMSVRFEKRLAHDTALKWFEIKARETPPLGICWFGDPHLGDDGCNIPLLRRDVETVRDTPGMYGANIGDTVNNWSGKLLRLYSEQNASRATERRLAKWFLTDSGVKWLLWLFGNHDTMDGAFAVHLRAVNAAQIPMIDWRAKFKVTFPNGAEIKIDAAHNHKGSSIWNELHGQERASMIDETADLFIAGHHHDWGIKQKELPDGIVTTLVRARGYKWIDQYATHHGFVSKQCGASIVTVLDPLAKSPVGRVRAFADVEEGAEFLTWLRNRAT